jgi:HK97 family phage portal protein
MWPFRRVKRRQQMTLEELLAESGTPTYAGMPVTADSSLRLSAVWAAVRLLADSVATLPLDVYRVGEREPLPTPPLLRAPAAGWALHEWLEAVMRSLLLRGNAYGVILDRSGTTLLPAQVELVNPDRVTPRTDDDGRLVYRVGGVDWPASAIWHVKAYRQAGLLAGLSPVEYARQSIGLGLAAEKYGGEWFAAGGVPTGTMRNSERTLSEVQAAEITDKITARIHRRQPLVYGSDWSYSPIAVKPAEAQFIESRQFSVGEIARVYGVPAQMLGVDLTTSHTYSSTEQLSSEFVTYGLRPWLVRLETALARLLPPGQYARFNPGALLKASLRDRYEAHKLAIEAGFLTVNEVRELEDRPPLEQAA